jgi:hypothetical protein
MYEYVCMKLMLNEGPSALEGTKCSFRCRVRTHALKELILKHKVPCNFHGVFAKDMNFEPKVDHCTTGNENLNVQQLPETI